MTSGGVGYDLLIPLSVFESLPRVGEPVTLHTHLVVKEDGWQLFGFATHFERQVFTRVLGAKGVGPAVALGLLSTLTAPRLVRALRDKDLAALQSVPRVGRKKAEQMSRQPFFSANVTCGSVSVVASISPLSSASSR